MQRSRPAPNNHRQRSARVQRGTYVYARPHAPRQRHTDGFHVPRAAQPAAVQTNQAQRPVAQSQAPVHKKPASLPVSAAAFKPANQPKPRRPLMPALMGIMAVVLFSFGVVAAISSLKTDRDAKAQVKGLATQATDDGIAGGVPNEDDAPDDISGYRVAPDLPRFFSIEKLAVQARVRRVGVSANNTLKAPANIFDVGWYDGSAKPGENGTVVLDGHVAGPTKRGVFYGIGRLAAGDKVSLERGDGKVFTYTVTGTQTYDHDKVDMAKVMTTSVPGKPGLNFITCAGQFNIRTNTYEQRVVVFAIQDI